MITKYKQAIGISLCALMALNTLNAEILQTSESVGVNSPKSVSQNSSSNVNVDSHNITPYGKIVDSNTFTTFSSKRLLNIDTNPFIYAQAYFDTETGFNYMKARYQNPRLTRFISQDSEDLKNRYTYGNGDPINNFDPTGHFSEWINYGLNFLGMIGGISSAIFSGGSLFALYAGITGSVSGLLGIGSQVSIEILENKDLSKTFENISFGAGILSLALDSLSVVKNLINRSSNYIGGGYKIKKVLASGTFGDVFYACKYNKKYAIKISNFNNIFKMESDLYTEAENWNYVQREIGAHDLATAKAIKSNVNISLGNKQYNGDLNILIMPYIDGYTMRYFNKNNIYAPDIEIELRTFFNHVESGNKYPFSLPDLHGDNIMYDIKNKRVIPIDLAVVEKKPQFV